MAFQKKPTSSPIPTGSSVGNPTHTFRSDKQALTLGRDSSQDEVHGSQLHSDTNADSEEGNIGPLGNGMVFAMDPETHQSETVSDGILASAVTRRTVRMTKWSSAMSWKDTGISLCKAVSRSLSMDESSSCPKVEVPALASVPPNTPVLSLRQNPPARNTPSIKGDQCDDSESSAMRQADTHPENSGRKESTYIIKDDLIKKKASPCASPTLTTLREHTGTDPEPVPQLTERSGRRSSTGRPAMFRRQSSLGKNLICYFLSHNLTAAAREGARDKMLLRSLSRNLITEKKAPVPKTRSLPGDLQFSENFGVLLNPTARQDLSLETGRSPLRHPFLRQTQAYTQTTGTKVEGKQLLRAFCKLHCTDSQMSGINEDASASFPQKTAAKTAKSISIAVNQLNVNTEKETATFANENKYADDEKMKTIKQIPETIKAKGEELQISQSVEIRSPSPTRRGKEKHGKLLYSVDSNSSFTDGDRRKMAGSSAPRVTVDYFAHPAIPITFTSNGSPYSTPKRTAKTISTSPKLLPATPKRTDPAKSKADSASPGTPKRTGPVLSKTCPPSPKPVPGTPKRTGPRPLQETSREVFTDLGTVDPENDDVSRQEDSLKEVPDSHSPVQDSVRTSYGEDPCASPSLAHILLQPTPSGRYQRKVQKTSAERDGRILESGIEKRHRQSQERMNRPPRPPGIDLAKQLTVFPAETPPPQFRRPKKKDGPGDVNSMHNPNAGQPLSAHGRSSTQETVLSNDSDADSKNQSPSNPSVMKAEEEATETLQAAPHAVSPSKVRTSADLPGGSVTRLRRFRCLFDVFRCCCDVDRESNADMSELPQ